MPTARRRTSRGCPSDLPPARATRPVSSPPGSSTARRRRRPRPPPARPSRRRRRWRARSARGSSTRPLLAGSFEDRAPQPRPPRKARPFGSPFLLLLRPRARCLGSIHLLDPPLRFDGRPTLGTAPGPSLGRQPINLLLSQPPSSVFSPFAPPSFWNSAPSHPLPPFSPRPGRPGPGVSFPDRFDWRLRSRAPGGVPRALARQGRSRQGRA